MSNIKTSAVCSLCVSAFVANKHKQTFRKPTYNRKVSFFNTTKCLLRLNMPLIVKLTVDTSFLKAHKQYALFLAGRLLQQSVDRRAEEDDGQAAACLQCCGKNRMMIEG